MNQTVKKLAAFLLAFCMMTSLTLSAGAADVETDMKDAVQEAGYTPVGSVMSVDAKAPGKAVEVELDLSGVKSGQSVVAAVQAVNAEGSAKTDHSLRYILVDEQGMVTIQENDCQYFVVLPVQGVLEQGWIDGLTTTSNLTMEGHEITLSAKLTMSDALATKAAFARGMDKLEDMRFTCRVESPLLKGMTAVDMSQVTFTDPNGIYTLIGAEVVNGGVEITYCISPADNDRLAGMGAETAKKQLQSTMSMSCTRAISPAVIKQGANEDGMIYTYGQVTITNGDGTDPIPGLDAKRLVVPGKLSEVEAKNLIDPSLVKLSADWNGTNAVTATVQNAGDVTLEGWLLCVAYDAGGRMLGYNGTYAVVNSGAGKDIPIALPAVEGTIDHAKVMLLDIANGLAPLCGAALVQ